MISESVNFREPYITNTSLNVEMPKSSAHNRAQQMLNRTAWRKCGKCEHKTSGFNVYKLFI